ncbi:helix-turn-helix domain-containing protein [Phenylobacterium sp. LjRoot164]|uniref:helix-turn-helix domain-containing protein n=1 Tax=unclassified Phenylobacterium TaxID=2640670 RepID=UPI003ECEEE8D
MSRTTGLRVGYVRAGQDEQNARARLIPHCEVVRTDPRADQPGGGLPAVLGFLRCGDVLIVERLQALGKAANALRALEALAGRGAVLQVLDPPLTAEGEAGRALAARLALMAAQAATKADAVLALNAAGVGPSEIARRLGVSRMTVWRRLRRPPPA